MAIKRVILTAGDTFTKPSDWNDANNSVYCLGAGAGGSGYVASGAHGGAGGGSGAFAQGNNISLAALASGAAVPFGIGVGGVGGYTNDATHTSPAALGFAGGDTYFNATSLANAVSKTSALSVAAQGAAANSVNYIGDGRGLAASSVGNFLTRNGSFGGTNALDKAGGGAGAPGPNGLGGAGGSGESAAGNYGAGGGGGADGGGAGANASGSNGGAGGTRTGGVAGTPGTPGGNGTLGAGGAGANGGTVNLAGGNGSNVLLWTDTLDTSQIGPGSGGGGGGSYGYFDSSVGGIPGYGAGGGGGIPNPGIKAGSDGGAGFIVVEWTPAAVVTSTVKRGGMGLGLGLGFSFGGGGSSGPTSGPTNSVAPTISNATIGVPMAVLSNGTWTGSPTYSYDWKVAGVSKGSTYTPVEADRTSSITCTVTATNGSGSASAASAGKTCRRTEPTIAYNFGTLTPVRSGTNHWGKVKISNLTVSASRPLLGTGVTAPTTWAVGAAASGDASWDRTVGDNYTPCRAGAISGAYVFTLTSTFGDAVVETQTLTITAKALAATIGEYDLNNSASLFASTLSSAVDVAGGLIEFAVGTDLTTSYVGFQNIRPTNRITIQHADSTRASYFAAIDIEGCDKLTLEGWKFGDYATRGYSNYRLAFLERGANPYCSNIIVNNYEHLASNPTYVSSGGSLYLFNITNSTFNNVAIKNVAEGIFTTFSTAIVFNNTTIDSFYGDGIFISGNSVAAGKVMTGITFNDTVLVRPMRIPGDTGHIDNIQLDDKANGGYVHFNRLAIIQGGGTAVAQGIFAGDGSTKPDPLVPGSTDHPELRVPIDLSVTGLIGAIALTAGVATTRADNSVMRFLGLTYTTHTNGGDAPTAGGPGIGLGYSDLTEMNGTNTISNSFAYSTITLSGWVDGLHNVQFGGTENPALFLNGAPQAYVEGIADSIWVTKTPAQCLALMKEAMRPATGSSLDGFSPISASTGNWHPTVLAA